MAIRIAVLSCSLVVLAAGQMLAAFEHASSSSNYATDGFAAELAVTPGSGYWCSAGGHSASQVVSWTGLAAARVPAVGVQVAWAYAPGEVKVLISSDGVNFEEAACWKQSSRQDVAYSETIFFRQQTGTKAVTILMRSPMPWGYFGITSAELLVKPFPFMLVSGSAGIAEECVVASSSGLIVQSCLGAIAAADGREVWSLSADGCLASLNGQCVTLIGGDVTAGGHVGFEACARASENGASNWVFTNDGQIKLKSGGDFCLSIGMDGGRVRSCAEAAASNQFMQVAVGEFDATASRAASNAANLLQAAVARQQKLLIQLQDAASKCGLGRLLANSSTPVALSTVRATGAALAIGTVSDVIAELYRVDLAPARQTIQASVNLVTALQAQVA